MRRRGGQSTTSIAAVAFRRDSEKMMSPFFTTKELGLAPGLGLNICGPSMEHGGTLDVDNSCANTRFVISLPEVANRHETGRSPHERNPKRRTIV